MIYAGSYPKNGKNRNLSSEALPLWNYREGDTIRVVSYTNCEKAELLLNGQKLGEVKNRNDDTGIISWDVPYHSGKLEVIGYYANLQAASYTIETSKRPNGISAVVANNIIASSDGVAQIEIQIVDEDGKPVLLADNEITCSTIGPVKLLGLEAGNPVDMGDYTDNRQRVFQGKMIAYLRSTGMKGTSKVTFSSPWLKEQIVVIEVE